MRKTIFVKAVCCCVSFFCFIALGLVSLPASSQVATTAAATAKEASPAVPSDPKELMLLATQSSGLQGSNVLPWHLKVTFRIFDEDGKQKDQGTYEEYWVNWAKLKSTFTCTSFTETLYRTGNGMLRAVKNTTPRPWQLAPLRDAIVGPWHPNAPVGNCVEYTRAQFTCRNPISYRGLLLPGDIEEGLGNLCTSLQPASYLNKL